MDDLPTSDSGCSEEEATLHPVLIRTGKVLGKHKGRVAVGRLKAHTMAVPVWLALYDDLLAACSTKAALESEDQWVWAVPLEAISACVSSGQDEFEIKVSKRQVRVVTLSSEVRDSWICSILTAMATAGMNPALCSKFEQPAFWKNPALLLSFRSDLEMNRKRREGTLQLGRLILKDWMLRRKNRRFVALYSDVLAWSKEQRQCNWLGVVPLEKITGVETNKAMLTVSIGCPSGKAEHFQLTLESDAQCDLWGTAMRKAVEEAPTTLSLCLGPKFWRNVGHMLSIRPQLAVNQERAPAQDVSHIVGIYKVHKEGWLMKKGTLRYFVLFEDVVAWCKTPEEDWLGVLPLEKVSVSKVSKCVFYLVIDNVKSTKGTEWSMRTNTQEECQAWVDRFANAIDKATKTPGLEFVGRFWKNVDEILQKRCLLAVNAAKNNRTSEYETKSILKTPSQTRVADPDEDEPVETSIFSLSNSRSFPSPRSGSRYSAEGASSLTNISPGSVSLFSASPADPHLLSSALEQVHDPNHSLPHPKRISASARATWSPQRAAARDDVISGRMVRAASCATNKPSIKWNVPQDDPLRKKKSYPTETRRAMEAMHSFGLQ